MNETLELANEFAKELSVQLPGYEANVVDLTNMNVEWVEVYVSHESYPGATVRFVKGELHSVSPELGLVRVNILKVLKKYL